MYAREIDGREFDFGVSGKLIRNVLVMYDRQTGSLWSQLLGEAVEGEMTGTKLEFLPSWNTTWRQWKEMFPDTVALRKPFRGGRDPYDSYYRASSAGVIGETLRDDRLATKEWVIGVELAGAAVAYPFGVLSGQPVVNDSVAGTPLLVVFVASEANGVVFSRAVGEQVLTFSRVEASPGAQDLEAGGGDTAVATESAFLLRDAETGSLWDALTGRALEGPLAGERLERVKSTTSFWFGWKDFHPDTLVYGLSS